MKYSLTQISSKTAIPIYRGHTSLMSKYLTREVFERLKDKKTSTGFTIARAVNSGVKKQGEVADGVPRRGYRLVHRLR